MYVLNKRCLRSCYNINSWSCIRNLNYELAVIICIIFCRSYNTVYNNINALKLRVTFYRRYLYEVSHYLTSVFWLNIYRNCYTCSKLVISYTCKVNINACIIAVWICYCSWTDICWRFISCFDCNCWLTVLSLYSDRKNCSARIYICIEFTCGILA